MTDTTDTSTHERSRPERPTSLIVALAGVAFAAVVVVVVLLTSSSGPSPGPNTTGPTQVTPSGLDTFHVEADQSLRYTQFPSELPADQEFVLELQVEGGVPHNVVFEGLNDDQPVIEANGASTVQQVLTLPPGTFTYYCSIPGHRAVGMEGTVEVEVTAGAPASPGETG
ncbi:MAG: plastocyanin/azurin family copper-binding protein [Euzebya sp.]